MKITIAGSGTAGLISALMLRKAFPLFEINVISSSKIGIIGVGEGSTEHWGMFMKACDISIGELLIKTRGTHKNGIRFENWTNHTPDYFHSISYANTNEPFGYYGLYNGLIQDGKTLTENIASRAMIENKVNANNPHLTVNQYHFDTFKLNEYLTSLCFFRGIKLIDSEILDVNLNSENGYISSVLLDSKESFESDFWIDATGLKQLLISKISNVQWNSFNKYLQMDSALAFPTESDASGEIRPYTRARAMPNGWVWEIPTQDRRGNGYVFSSNHCSDEQAIQEVSQLLNFEVQPSKVIKFNPGHVKEFWVKNCVVAGLAGSFMEPIEATSIGGTIQQMFALIQYLCVYDINSKKIQEDYNKKMNNMIENILAMISLHYISDRDDSEMWRMQKEMPIPDYLLNLLELWKERPIFSYDIPHNNYELFHAAHFAHVAQGQKLFSSEKSLEMINSFGIAEYVKNLVWDAKMGQTGHAKVDHAESLKQIQI